MSARTSLSILGGVILGCVLGVGIRCGQAWCRGGSADPRCVFAGLSYIERHVINHGVDRVTCEYRPGDAP